MLLTIRIKSVAPNSKMKLLLKKTGLYRNIAVLLSLKFRSAILGGGSLWRPENRLGAKACGQWLQGAHPYR